MGEPKSTPGPWVVSDASPGSPEYAYEPSCIGPEDSDEVVCWPNEDVPEEVRVANSNLIAAAPGLYAACERLEAAYRDGDRNFHRLCDDAWGLARAALAKARGGA